MNSFTLKSNLIRLDNTSRLYNIDKPIIGLTGGIATGKSSTSRYLASLGIEIIDADQLVHNIYQSEDTISFIESISPELIKNSRIDKRTLRKVFFTNNHVKSTVESFIYSKLQDEFLKKCESISQSFIVYDVPLLFEKALEDLVDINILIYAPKNKQIQRLKQRDQISNNLAEKILEAQQDIEIKRKKAMYVIENTKSIKDLEQAVKSICSEIFLHFT